MRAVGKHSSVCNYMYTFLYRIYEDSFRTSQRTQWAFAGKTKQWMLYREIMAVYCKKHLKHKYCEWTKWRACGCKADCSYAGVIVHCIASLSKYLASSLCVRTGSLLSTGHKHYLLSNRARLCDYCEVNSNCWVDRVHNNNVMRTYGGRT